MKEHTEDNQFINQGFALEIEIRKRLQCLDQVNYELSSILYSIFMGGDSIYTSYLVVEANALIELQEKKKGEKVTFQELIKEAPCLVLECQESNANSLSNENIGKFESDIQRYVFSRAKEVSGESYDCFQFLSILSGVKQRIRAYLCSINDLDVLPLITCEIIEDTLCQAIYSPYDSTGAFKVSKFALVRVRDALQLRRKGDIDFLPAFK